MQPSLQVDIVNVTERLGQSAMQRATVVNIGATSDLMKHLRKCLQNSSKFSNPRGGSDGWNADLQFALEKCISQLSDKAFPDDLFHQLLVAMPHPDHETRFGAHSVFRLQAVYVESDDGKIA
ncbi:hypothetical protein NC653_037483 [Populus alba x Populus x berolinensis]|uniref:Uncharacterized protein n=1 Tax=Populus alba x Populus x berolinensis TaxID=444605 RepID=A0AAD6LEG4_9ROSI|nr:hypothetical protein NC653_037483 [Populus alba x Populus x berolinensis]